MTETRERKVRMRQREEPRFEHAVASNVECNGSRGKRVGRPIIAGQEPFSLASTRSVPLAATALAFRPPYEQRTIPLSLSFVISSLEQRFSSVSVPPFSPDALTILDLIFRHVFDLLPTILISIDLRHHSLIY